MISIGLGDGLHNGIAIQGRAKQVYQPQLTPAAYMELLQNCYHEHGDYIRYSLSPELYLRAHLQDTTITAHFLFDQEKLTFPAMFERARGVGRASFQNGHFGISFPLAPRDYWTLSSVIEWSSQKSLLRKSIFEVGDFVWNCRFVSKEIRQSVWSARRLIRKDGYKGEKTEPLVIMAVNTIQGMTSNEDVEARRMVDDYYKMDPHIFILAESAVKWVVGKDESKHELPE